MRTDVYIHYHPRSVRDSGGFVESEHPRNTEGEFSTGQNNSWSSQYERNKNKSLAEGGGDSLDSVIPKPSKEESEKFNRMMEKLEYSIIDTTTKEVPLSKVVSQQKTVSNEIVENYQDPETQKFDEESGVYPEAYEYEGKIYLVEGNHRVTAAMLSGKGSLKMNISTIREEAQRNEEVEEDPLRLAHMNNELR